MAAAPLKGWAAAFSRMEDEPFDYSEEAFVYDGPVSHLRSGPAQYGFGGSRHC